VKENKLSVEDEGAYRCARDADARRRIDARRNRRKMLRKESYYLRLRRQKSHINEFNVLTVIGLCCVCACT
jgi:hypothetical protein